MGQIALISSVIAFIMAAITLVLSGLGLWHFRRAPLDEEIPRLQGASTLVPAPATPARDLVSSSS